MSDAPSVDIDGPLYVEVSKIYEEMYCQIIERKFLAFKKARANLPASKANKLESAVVEVRNEEIISSSVMIIMLVLSVVRYFHERMRVQASEVRLI